MEMRIQDAMYGLRNLIISDGEEERIDEMFEDDMSSPLARAVLALVELDEYRAAYEVAIRFTLKALTPDEVKRAARLYIEEWQDMYDDEADVTIDELVREWDRVRNAK